MYGKLAGKKTYITAAFGVVGAVLSVATGEATAIQAAQSILTCLLAAFVRNGMGNAS